MGQETSAAAEPATAPSARVYREPDIQRLLDAGEEPGRVARRGIEQMRELMRRRHLAGAGGTEIARGLSAATDALVRALLRHARSVYEARYPRFDQQLAVFARGGYGRSELSPYSDIDLLFLYNYKPGPYVEVVTEVVLHALWDAGLVVGHVVRNLRETVRAANGDLREKCALLDARFLGGDRALGSALERALVEQVIPHQPQSFFNAKLEETRQRHQRFGDTVYLLQPQLREGEGGLRDFQSAHWMAQVRYRAGSLNELVQKAVIGEREWQAAAEAHEFLLRLRNSLHFLSGRHNDQLTFEYQEPAARMMGFAAEASEAADALMRAYYQQASAIHRFCEDLTTRITAVPPAPHGRWRGAKRQIRPGIFVQGDLLLAATGELFKRDPVNLVSVFSDCQAHGVRLSAGAYQLVRENLLLLSEELRQNPGSGPALMRILNGRERVAETLDEMHRAGVLGALIPEFANLYARVLHDLYHIYTVDRHCLAAVRELERLRSGAFKEGEPLLTDVAREMESMPLVFLALLLHDIGKGHGHDHHERGATLTEGVCRRLGLDGEATEFVVFLVRHHLLMAHVAQKADFQEPGTLERFALAVGSIDRLKALYLLTFADLRAVAPNVYSQWRAMLLGDLYMRTLKLLEHGHLEAVDPARRLALAKAHACELLRAAKAESGAAGRFLDLMPDRYFLVTPAEEIAGHFELMEALGSDLLVSRQRHFPELEFSEFTIVTPDQPGLFAKLAGTLTANDINILSARITTRRDGLALDVFRVCELRGGAVVEGGERRWSRLHRTLEDVLSGRTEIEALVRAAQRRQSGGRKFVRRLGTEVTADNDASQQFTVVDVFTQDRMGLLFEVTHALFKLGLLIHLARVSTNADQALDVFYVSDALGRKITEPQRLEALRAALAARLDNYPDQASPT